MWKLDSLAFRGLCPSWNRDVHTIFHLPFTTHTYILGPLMKQSHMSSQLYKRCAHFHIVRTCLTNAIHNARTPLGHYLASF